MTTVTSESNCISIPVFQETMDIDWYQCDCSHIIIEIQEILALLEEFIVMCANINACDSLNWG